MSEQQDSHKHHYVPNFLMRPWTIDGLLNGYSWETWRQRLRCRKSGTDGFCYQRHLVSLEQHPEGRDVLERQFFGEVDSKGARARDRIMEDGPQSLRSTERCDFARVMLSLEVRAPEFVASIRTKTLELAESMDSDAEILEAMKLKGISGAPSQWYTSEVGHAMQDRSFARAVQRLVDNPNIGGRLINGQWQLVRLGGRDGTFVLADHPVVRLPERGVWFLPLGPRAALCMLPARSGLLKMSAQKFAKELNKASAEQARKYVFSIDEHHERWLGKHLAANAARTGQRTET